MVSKPTPITISSEVPPIWTDFGKPAKLPKIIGKIDIAAKNKAPDKVMRVITLVK